jgi:hypothetical protein
MPGYWSELRRNALLLFPLTLLALLGLLFADNSWRGLWQETSAAVTRPAMLVVVIGAATAAQRAAGFGQRSVAELHAVMPRPKAQIDLARLAGLATPFLAAYVVMAGVGFVVTAMVGSPGGPQWSYPTFALLGIVVAVSFGFAVGRAFPSRFTGALMGVAAVLSLSFLPYDGGLSLYIPHQTVSHAFDDSLLLVRVLLAVTACAAAISIGYLRRTERMGERAPFVPSLAVSAVLLSMALSAASGPLLIQRPAPTAAACAEVSGSRVCVWPEHEPLLGDATQAAASINAALQKVARPPQTYVEVGLPPAGDLGFLLDYGDAGLANTMVDQALPDPAVCDGISGTSAIAQADAHRNLTIWLEARALGSDTIPSNVRYFSSEPGWREPIEAALRLSDSDQEAQAREWLATAQEPC